MIECPTNSRFLLLFLFFRIFLVMGQNTTFIPVNVGVVLDLDTWSGKMELSCINMALADFYASHSNYSTRLVLHTRNSARDVVAAAGAALDLINNVGVQAIIGLESSMQANFVIDLGDKAQVPILSFSATSPSLQGSYFFRIAQNDLSQVAAISTIIQAFGWSEAVPISIDNEFGKGLIPYLITALQAVGAHVPYWSVIPSTAIDEEIVAELYKLMSMPTRVFIVHMSPFLGSRLFSKAKAIGMMDEGYVWIITNGMTNSFSSSSSSDDIDNMQGVLGLKTYIPNTKELEDFRARWQRKFQLDNPTFLDIKLDVYGLWAYDAAWALAIAIEKVGSPNFSFQKLKSSGNSTDLERLEVSQGGPKLVQELSGTSFRGLSGVFSLIDGQMQSSTFQIVNVNDNGERRVGYWTPQNGLVRNLKKNTSTSSASNASLAPIIWPGDTTSTPMGWRFPVNGRNLRIGVPVKKRFEEFVGVIHDPSTKTTVLTGYSIDVFRAVIEALPYSVPYEFFPVETSDSNKDGNYNYLVNEVSLGNYDAAVGDFTLRVNRSLHVDFTLPYTESGVSMVVPIKANSRAKNTWVFLKPWSLDLWVTSGVFFIIIGSVIWFLEHRINEDFRGPPRYQIGTSLWFSFSTMVFGQREPVVGILARFVVVVWCFVVLILTQSYTASLSSILTIQQLQPVITDVDPLIKNGETVGYQAGSFIRGILLKMGFQDENLQAYESLEELDELLQNGNENHGVSAAFDETPYMKLFLARYCSMYSIIVTTFQTNGFAFVFQKGSLLTPDFSTAIAELHEGDRMKVIEKKWFNNSCSKSNTADSSNTLSLDSFWGLFIVVAVASSLAVLIFTAMFLYEHRRTLTDRETTFWGRVRAILIAYDQEDTSSHTYKKKRKQGVHGTTAVVSTPNTNIFPGPLNHPTQIASEIVLEELGTPSPEHGDLNANGQETQETLALASSSEVGSPNTHYFYPERG